MFGVVAVTQGKPTPVVHDKKWSWLHWALLGTIDADRDLVSVPTQDKDLFLGDERMWSSTPLLLFDLVQLFSDTVNVALKLDDFDSFGFL